MKNLNQINELGKDSTEIITDRARIECYREILELLEDSGACCEHVAGMALAIELIQDDIAELNKKLKGDNNG